MLNYVVILILNHYLIKPRWAWTSTIVFQNKSLSTIKLSADAPQFNKKQSQKTEDIEARLMELEDYVFKPSEIGRILRLNEQL